MTKLLIYNF